VTVLWLGGAQWAGKSSVARILSDRHGLQLYSYDYHDARGHSARARAEPDRFPHLQRFLQLSMDERWVLPSPERMATDAQIAFDERFQMTLDDLAALPAEPPVLAEGWGLRPRLVAPLLEDPRQAIFVVPSDEFRERQAASMPRAGAVGSATSDPERAQRNRVARDRLLTADVTESARELGLRTVVVDGSGTVDDLAALVAEHFAPFLPRARPILDEHLQATMTCVREGDHDAGVRLALAGRELFPERPEITSFWVIAALTAAGRTEEALAALEEAAGRDLTWRFGLYSSPVLAAIRDSPRFQAAMERSRERFANFAGPPLVRAWDPPGAPAGERPLALLLHGANASMAQFANTAPDVAAAGWLAACCQSSQPTSRTTFCWDDRARADADVDAFGELAGPHDPGRVIAVGYS
jgi:hypothetical protein